MSAGSKLRRDLKNQTKAKALRFTATTIKHTLEGKPVSASMAFRVARLAGVTVDDVLAGRYPAPGTCPYCGRPPAGSDDDPRQDGLKLINEEV
jgi:hypothetical protein